MPSHSQIIIVGAGPTGTLLALNLHQQGKKVLLIEARSAYQTVTDTRTLALSYPSIQNLREAGVKIDDQDITRIKKVHVSQQSTFGHTMLTPEDINLPDLGGVIDYYKLINACDQALIDAQIPVLWETQATHIQATPQFSVVNLNQGNQEHAITCQWCVLAEGGHLTESLPKIKRRIFDYEQSALVATVLFANPHQNCAFECFAKTGPLVLLPYQKQNMCRLVWTQSTLRAHSLFDMDEGQFISELINSLGLKLGQIESVTDKAIFPLYLKQLNQLYFNRVICIGNAAQTMHPVAAQGLNLGIRDAMQLAKMFENHDLDDGNLAQKYAASRRVDAHSIVGFTHGLITVFDRDLALLSYGRGAVLNTLNHVTPLRKKFMEYLFYGVGLK